ncbi:hypothetical protein MSAN_00957200 [Mycena sanguinolenta]|uniref:Uncharacterized protein n=1 Tax=Mycena sanguinolenta TaxID=230812 RepID=A0A8H7DA70_9AGAR|nr:hypothetical protein MSAN_00957200 [Mycena sanguinolenta]
MSCTSHAHGSPDLPTQPSPVRERGVNGAADASAAEEQPAATSPPDVIQGMNAAPAVVPSAETRNHDAASAAGDVSQPASCSGNARQGAAPVPAANVPGSAAGSAPRRSALDGLSAEERARRREAIGRSGAGGSGPSANSSTRKSGPVASSRALSKPERKARREAWEADLLEVAVDQESTIQRLLKKYPEKREADIRKLMAHTSTLKSSRKLTLYNALLHDLCLKSQEESGTGKGKSSIEIQQELGSEALREMMDNLEEDERARLLEKLGEYRVTQRHGTRKTNKAQAADVRQNMEKFDALFSRTGMRAMVFAVRSDTHDPNEPTFIETGGSRDFLGSYFGKSYQEIGHNYELWSVAKGRGESKSNSISAVRSEINKEVHTKLRIITGKKDAKMSWSNYEIDICEALKVKMVGWLVTQTDADGNVSIKMAPLNQLPAEIARLTLKGLKNGTIFLVEMSKVEHDALVAKHDALRAANGPLKKRKKTRSDFGKTHASRKRKADEDEDEDEEDEEGSGEESEERSNERRAAAEEAAYQPRHPCNCVKHAEYTDRAQGPRQTQGIRQTHRGRAKARGRRSRQAHLHPRSPFPAHGIAPAPPTASAPATNVPALNNAAPTLRLPSPEPSHAMYTSAVPTASAFTSAFTSSPSAFTSVPSFEALAFGTPAPDAWGLAQVTSSPVMEFSADLMSLLGEAVGTPNLWGSGGGSVPSGMQGQPLQPLNVYRSTLPSGATPTDGLAPKHMHSNLADMRGENAPPSAADAARTFSASGPSPAPYLMTRFRI